uniref:Uncharacterized protein n=1 Tax=Cacopsylla melanoneura TaxID=428564 RepID=A0A8D9BMI5_9HEMI
MIYLCRVVPVVLFLSNEHVLVVGVFRIIEGMNETVQGWVWGGRVLGGLLFIHLFKEVYIFGFVWPIKMLSGHCPVRVRVFHLFPVVVCIVSMFPNFRLSYAVGALFRGVGRLCSDEIVGVIDSVFIRLRGGKNIEPTVELFIPGCGVMELTSGTLSSTPR